MYPALTSSKFLLNLVNDMLDLAQLEAGTFKLIIIDFDFWGLMKDCLQIIKIQARNRGIFLNLDIKPEVKKIVKSDPNRIRQVTYNLLSKKLENSLIFSFFIKGNALKYTTKGNITLSAQIKDQKQIEVSISDTGLGIKNEDKNKLFKAFGKIQDETNNTLNSQGVGLGLIISNKLTKQLNEQGLNIDVESEWEKGSRFSFIFDNHLVSAQDEVTESNRKTNKVVNDLKTLDYKFIYQIDNSTNSVINSILEESFQKANSIAFISSLKLNSLKSSINNKKKKNNRKSFFISEATSYKTSLMGSICEELKIEDMEEQLKQTFETKKCECPLALVLDDNDFNILALQGHLKRLEIKSDSALSTDEAMVKVRNLFESNSCCRNYRYLFIDIEMPLKDGFVAINEINNFYAEKEVDGYVLIAVTAHNNGSDIVTKIREKGIEEVMFKPLSYEVMVTTLRRMYQRKKGV